MKTFRKILGTIVALVALIVGGFWAVYPLVYAEKLSYKTPSVVLFLAIIGYYYISYLLWKHYAGRVERAIEKSRLSRFIDFF